jgi:23S rRNA A2030 N6-methylase RlmJ
MRLLEGVVEDLSEADKRMKITSGNLVIDKLSGQGNYDLQAGDFQKALEVITTIIAAKEARNNNAIPSNLRSLNLQMLRNLKKSLMEAMQ